MNILVTGASGFVGGAIMSGLKNENNVVGIGRRDLPCCGYDYHRADISELSSLEEILGIIKPDVIVHSAAAISHDGLDKSLIDTNVRGTANVLNLARMAGCKKIIYISGAPIIGSPTEIPVTEDHEVYPLSVYHLTKYFGEVLFQEAADMRTAILRLPSPIGAGMPENKILPVFIRNCLSGLPIKLLGEGRRLQNYINVRDVAVAVRRTIQCDVTGIFNVTYPKSYSNLEIAVLCKKELHSSSEIQFAGEDPEEGMRWIYSSEKIRAAMDFRPEVTIEESIHEIALSIRNENSCNQ